MNVQTHWEKIYAEKAPDAVSWYRLHLETSLALIRQATAGHSASVTLTSVIGMFQAVQATSSQT